jgi:aminomuconate-semialdehyde/2-hydroxymuconate-6-semialdehyde dehydrogenase
MKIDHYIQGDFVSSTSTFTKLNPFTNEILATVSNANAMDVVKAVQAAQKAFSDWKTTSLADRLLWLQKIKNAYINLKQTIIDSESLDQGLSASFTEKANYLPGLKFMDRFADEFYAKMDSVESQTQHTAVGTVAVILSWNLSNRLFIERALAAALAGNTVIVKCSSVAPCTALIWSQLLMQIQFPVGVIQFIHGQDQSFKDLLITHPSIKAVSVTASLKNGSDILKKSSALSHSQFKKIQISTGGKNPAIVLSEPTSDLAREVFDSFLYGQGQLAWNSSRLFILEKHAAQWSELLMNYLDDMVILEDIQQTSAWSPIIKQTSKDHFNDIQQLAKADQAKLIFSKKHQTVSNNFLIPTFTKDMSNCSTLQQDQVLAPLFIISEVKYPFDIPKYSNVSYYGMAASLWSDPQKASKVVEGLDVGHVSLNRWWIHSDGSVKAVKQSAFGQHDYRIFGDFFSNAKTLSIL